MNRTLIEWPNPTLRKQAKEIKSFDDTTRQLAVDLIDTCNMSMGVGLAAPQINISKSMVVVKPMDFIDNNPDPADYNPEYMVLVNPKIVSSSDECERWKEACLSIPGFTEYVTRPSSIEVSYYDLDGEAKTLQAEWPFSGALQHEIDHVYGKVYLNHINRVKRSMIRDKIMKQRKKERRSRKKQLKHN